jgi:hypothetical protein
MDGTFTDLTTLQLLTRGSTTTMTASVSIINVLFWHGISNDFHQHSSRTVQTFKSAIFGATAPTVFPLEVLDR